jgi:hydroxymethylpyrimidine/phosphomethylpyrimidine kinase
MSVSSVHSPVKTALTIAGSDPSGGAGIQADLKTFSRLRVYGMAVVAAMTAQNTLGVSSVAEVAPDFVGQQLDAVFTDIRPDAVKTGMLLTAGVIDVVAKKVNQYGIGNLVVDPVMMSTSKATLMNPDAITIFRRTLLPLALLITPNSDEAAALTGNTINTVAEMKQAASEIHRMGAAHVLIKGGHVEGDDATDVLFDGKEFSKFRSSRIATRNTHGTGCVLSASIAAYLALGASVKEAVGLGKEFVTAAIKNALQIGHGAGPCDPLSLGG